MQATLLRNASPYGLEFQIQFERQHEELDREFEFIGTALSRLERQVSEVSSRVDAVTARVDESVRQADLDRRMFVNAVERLIEILNQQFTSNGSGEG